MNITESAKSDLMRIRPCIRMEKVITELATNAGVDLSGNEGHLQIDNELHHRLCIKKVESNLLAVSDYSESNGKYIPDTDAVFLMIDRYWYPVFFVDQTKYEEPVEFGSDEQIISVLDNMKSTVSYTSEWANNIVAQGFLDNVKTV